MGIATPGNALQRLPDAREGDPDRVPSDAGAPRVPLGPQAGGQDGGGDAGVAPPAPTPDPGASSLAPSARPELCSPTVSNRVVCHDGFAQGCACPTTGPCCLACDGAECTCPPGQSCDFLVLDQTPAAEVTCPRGSHCVVKTERSVNVRTRCQAGSSCDVDCMTRGRCKILCAANARCRADKHGSSSGYQLVCAAGRRQTCPNDERVCRVGDCE